MSAPRAFLYVQHLLGIGHLARASRIARALKADGFEVAVVTGGMPVPGFPGPDLHHITLPAIQSSDAGFSGLADAQGRPVDDAFKAARRDMLLAAYRDFAPDVVITEAFPFGRRQVRFELLPLLKEIHGQGQRPRVVASIRDILQARAKPGRDEESLALIEDYYDAVLVHGDPDFVRLEETFPLANRIAGRIRYTGLVAPEPVAPAADPVDITVSAGGGAVGRALIGAAAEAARLLDPGLRWRLVTGPNLPQADYDALAADLPPGAELVRFLPAFTAQLAASRLSISQAGYNTVCDALVAGCRALLLPFAAGGETEQTERAERLQALGLARMLQEAEATGPKLAALVAEMLTSPAPGAHRLNLDGARGTARVLRALL